MTSLLPLAAWSLSEAVSRLRDGSLSPVQLVDACLAQIERHDATVHAFVTLAAEPAREQARIAEREIASGHWRGPLHGIPIGVKDVIDVAGLPTCAQSALRAQAAPAVSHAASVRSLTAAGAIVLGKLTTHEFAFGIPEYGPAGPPARNPWDVARFAGGSSSGAAVGVACGMILGAVGTDTAGSVRSPAALCGMTGFKPGRARIDRQGALPLAPSLDAIGVIATTADDCALLYHALATVDDVRHCGMRIGMVRHFFTDAPAVAQDTLRAVEDAVKVFESIGGPIDDVHLPALADWNAAGMTLLLYEAFALHRSDLTKQLPRYGQSFADAVLLGATITSADHARAQGLRATLCAALARCFDDYDLLIVPIQPAEAPLFEQLSTWGFLERPSYGIPFNLADLPAISLCCGFGAHGLPLAVQLVGRAGDEARVLQAAQAFQARTDWHRRSLISSPA